MGTGAKAEVGARLKTTETVGSRATVVCAGTLLICPRVRARGGSSRGGERYPEHIEQMSYR